MFARGKHILLTTELILYTDHCDQNMKKNARKKSTSFSPVQLFFGTRFHLGHFFAPDSFPPSKFLARRAAGGDNGALGDTQRGTGVSWGPPSPRVPKVLWYLEGRVLYAPLPQRGMRSLEVPPERTNKYTSPYKNNENCEATIW